MYRLFAFIGILGMAATLEAASKTPLDLMIEGRYKEAKTIIENSNVSPRYQLIYFALLEADAARACSLYQVIAVRYPETDCDSVARARLNLAQDMGYVLVPVAEWAEADNSVKPLELRKPVLLVSEEEPPVSISEPNVESEAPDSIQPAAVPENAEPEPVTPEPLPTETESAVTDISVPIPVPAISGSLPSVARTIPVAEPEPEPESESADTLNVPGSEIAEATPVAEPSAREVIQTPPVAEPIPEAIAPSPETEEPAVKDIGLTPPANESNVETIPPPVVAEEPAVKEVIPAPPAAEPIGETIPVVSEVKTEPIEEPAAAVSTPEVKAEPEPMVQAKTESQSSPEAKTQLQEEIPNSNGRAISNGRYYIQVGAFANFDNAHRLAKTLQKAGFPVKLVMRENSDRKFLQVRVGGYHTLDAVEPVKTQLKDEFNLPIVVVTE